MAVVLVHQGPDVTRESYDQVVRSMTGKDRAESPSDWPVEGLLVHAAGEGPNGFRVVDVWESEDAAQRFGEKLAPHLKEAGITAEPEVYQAHAFVSAWVRRRGDRAVYIAVEADDANAVREFTFQGRLGEWNTIEVLQVSTLEGVLTRVQELEPIY